MADVPVEFQQGNVVSGLESTELVEIKMLSPFARKALVEGVGVESRCIIRRLFAADELAKLVRVRGTKFTFDGDPQAFLLRMEAERIRIAHQFDPLSAVNFSLADPLPHRGFSPKPWLR